MSADVEDTQRHLGSFSDPLVLWVDDNPSWTAPERDAMEALGISFDLSVSTDSALEKLQRRPYDAVISDMGRPEGGRAGYALLDFLMTPENAVKEHIANGAPTTDSRVLALLPAEVTNNKIVYPDEASLTPLEFGAAVTLTDPARAEVMARFKAA